MGGEERERDVGYFQGDFCMVNCLEREREERENIDGYGPGGRERGGSG